jgi:hypothetical protein
MAQAFENRTIYKKWYQAFDFQFGIQMAGPILTTIFSSGQVFKQQNEIGGQNHFIVAWSIISNFQMVECFYNLKSFLAIQNSNLFLNMNTIFDV